MPCVTNRQRDDLELIGLLVLYEPSPTTTLDSSEVGVEGLLEVAEVAPVLVNGSSELAGRWVATTTLLGHEVLPEEGVVDVSSFGRGGSAIVLVQSSQRLLPSVKLQQCLEVDLGLHVVVLSGDSILLLRLVEHVDVGLMVLGVVKLLSYQYSDIEDRTDRVKPP